MVFFFFLFWRIEILFSFFLLPIIFWGLNYGLSFKILLFLISALFLVMKPSSRLKKVTMVLNRYLLKKTVLCIFKSLISLKNDVLLVEDIFFLVSLFYQVLVLSQLWSLVLRELQKKKIGRSVMHWWLGILGIMLNFVVFAWYLSFLHVAEHCEVDCWSKFSEKGCVMNIEKLICISRC